MPVGSVTCTPTKIPRAPACCAGKDSVDAFVAEGGLEISEMLSTVWKDDPDIAKMVASMLRPYKVLPAQSHMLKGPAIAKCASCSVQ